jgi:hypothetical protein
MKTNKINLIALLLLLVLCACGPTEEKYFNVQLLYGEWAENSLHETYAPDGTGHTWDLNDEVSEDEAQPFEWTLSHDTLLQNHLLWNGAIVPKVYLITTLDSANLVYQDFNSDRIHTYKRVFRP